MKILLFLLPLMAFANPDCPKQCDVPGAPTLPQEIAAIRENVTGECAEVSEIVVSPRNPEDPCNFDNIAKIRAPNIPEEAEVAWTARIDKSYRAGGNCGGKVSEGLCYNRINNIYARNGSHTWFRDPEGDGLILDIKKSPGCSGESCVYPYEQNRLTISVPYENIYDTQQRENTVIECRPENCYSISLGSQSSIYTPGRKYLGHQTITVTRMPDGTLQTRLYVNMAYTTVTTPYTVDGRLGEDVVHAELVGKAPDTFKSCDEPYSSRRP